MDDRDQQVARPVFVTSLSVAVLAPVSWRVPPRHYGPWEQFASLLTEGLVDRGIDVTLFATADSVTTARLASVVPRGYSEDPNVEPKVTECLHIGPTVEPAPRRPPFCDYRRSREWRGRDGVARWPWAPLERANDRYSDVALG